MGIIAKLNNLCKEIVEICSVDQEKRDSVHCPYCGEFYSSQDIRENESETDIPKTTCIQCKECNSIFGIVTETYYEPTLSSWKKTARIKKNLDYIYTVE